jgi:hypothetical protein
MGRPMVDWLTNTRDLITPNVLNLRNKSGDDHVTLYLDLLYALISSNIQTLVIWVVEPILKYYKILETQRNMLAWLDQKRLNSH